ncbi:hypothetical protein LTR53_015641 [Teratosphaeriaceae sp. CCFEE 6253]|nr:hypothetical protein LTR53_015641 [Teratosphaeriaceae sp. CCFEE 6253]
MAEPSTTADPADLKSELRNLLALATEKYALKQYAPAAEVFSQAAEVQDQLNGEMSPENADLLYQYGRCLYHVAVGNSDVLGGKVAGVGGEPGPRGKKRKVRAREEGEGVDGKAGGMGAATAGASSGAHSLLGNAPQLKVLEQEDDDSKASGDVTVGEDAMADGKEQNGAKPFFQITGDENWTDSDDSDPDDADVDAHAAAEAEGEEEEDDFAIAYEILDDARILFTRKLADAGAETIANPPNTTTTTMPPEVRHLKERLADTHDLQAEISLENERFADAITDTRDALALKRQLYPAESSLLAEAHFKLSLALEFASVTTAGGEGGEGVAEAGKQTVDEGMRAQAAAEMEQAITSCMLRIAKESAALTALDAAESNERRKAIAEVEEMVAEMQLRLVDLRNPAVSMIGNTAAGTEGLGGVLGAMLGGQRGPGQTTTTAGATGGREANDLSGVVRKKVKVRLDPVGVKVALAQDPRGWEAGRGKRKAENGEGEDGTSGEGSAANGKRVQFDDGGVD